ncbi:MAG: IclR family transcriptional regulator [Candidatus Kryptonium sp.]|nr:IclR family transcriptional regulator [Candidatus Kryptonium sp.]
MGIYEFKSPNKYTVPAVKRSIEILNLLEKSDKPLSLSEISKHINYPRSSIFRILVTLESYGFVERNSSDNTFTLGIRLSQLGIAKLNKINLGYDSYKYLEELAKKTGESVYLAVLHNYRVVLIQRVDSPSMWSLVTQLGLRSPVHCTASGQVLISEMSDEELSQFIKKTGLKKYTEKTITRLSELKMRLKKVREQGFAIVDREYNPELVAVAAPIRNAWGKIIAALLITLQYRGSKTISRAYELAKDLKEYAEKISKQMGYAGK